MKTCPKCEHEVENDDNVCSNCSTRLREKCPKCGQMEPVRFVNAQFCQTKAKKSREEFISANHDHKPFVMIGIGGILMFFSFFLTAIIYVIGLTFFLVGYIYSEKEDKKWELLFIKNNPEIGVLLIEE